VPGIPPSEGIALNGAVIITAILCFAFIIFMVVAFEVAAFLVACRLSDVPSPGLMRGFGIVLVLLVVPAIFDALFGSVLFEVYKARNYPLWEAGLCQFFLALPMHMGICALIHAKMMSLKFGQGLTVWFVEKVLKFGIAAVIAGIVALFYLAGQAA
jgi:hypothetical protein